VLFFRAAEGGAPFTETSMHSLNTAAMAIGAQLVLNAKPFRQPGLEDILNNGSRALFPRRNASKLSEVVC